MCTLIFLQSSRKASKYDIFLQTDPYRKTDKLQTEFDLIGAPSAEEERHARLWDKDIDNSHHWH